MYHQVQLSGGPIFQTLAPTLADFEVGIIILQVSTGGEAKSGSPARSGRVFNMCIIFLKNR